MYLYINMIPLCKVLSFSAYFFYLFIGTKGNALNMGIFKKGYSINISVFLTLQKWVHINMVQVEQGFRNPTGASNVNHRGMEILPLKVASKLRFGVDLSPTLLPLHTEFRPPSLLCVNSLPLLSVLTVEHVSLHGERKELVIIRYQMTLTWFVASKIQEKFKAMTTLSFSPLVSFLNIPQCLWSLSSKNVLCFYSVQSSLAPEYESTALQGRRSTEVCQSPSPPIFVSFSWRAETHHRGFFALTKKCARGNTLGWTHFRHLTPTHILYSHSFVRGIESCGCLYRLQGSRLFRDWR